MEEPPVVKKSGGSLLLITVEKSKQTIKFQLLPLLQIPNWAIWLNCKSRDRFRLQPVYSRI
jgi:hypothetical protein